MIISYKFGWSLILSFLAPWGQGGSGSDFLSSSCLKNQMTNKSVNSAFQSIVKIANVLCMTIFARQVRFKNIFPYQTISKYIMYSLEPT